MNKVKIKDIADELGINSKDVLHKAILMVMNVKSIKSSVSNDDAQKIFDAIINNRQTNIEKTGTLFYNSKNINIYLCENSFDVNFLNNLSLPHTNQGIDNFLLFSYNYPDEILQEFYSMSLDKLDIEKYLKNKFNDDDFTKLQDSIKNFSNDFDIGRIDDNNPLENIKLYSNQFKPQLIFIEGIDFISIENNKFEIFDTIQKMALFNIKFELGIVNVDINRIGMFRDKIHDIFK